MKQFEIIDVAELEVIDANGVGNVIKGVGGTLIIAGGAGEVIVGAGTGNVGLVLNGGRDIITGMGVIGSIK